ncbi:MAG: type II toxin-antitoxin system HicA family toxin [Chthoniobacterales bacterium]|nr:type II toxin-antitoxin system HicA family toxin [Chthoniobacterales bacterium]
MKLPRNLSGKELAAVLCRHWNYYIVHQVGSHIILQTDILSHQRIPIPAHAFLRIGTLNAILKMIATHKEVRKEDILESL